MAKAKKSHSEEESGLSEILRRFKEHPFIFGGTVVLLLFIIIAFVFVPTMPSIQKDSETPVFGYFNGKPITQNAFFINALQESAYMAGFDLQSDYSVNTTIAHQVWYQAFIKTFIHIAVLDEMKNAGYKAPSGEIDRQVALNPEFQEEGRFSIVKYRSYDKNRLLSLWRNTEESHIFGKYYDDIMGLKVSSAEKKFIGEMAYPERSFEIVCFPRSAYPDSELLAFAASRQDLFKIVHLSRITVSAEKEARQLLDSLKEGKTAFEDAARNYSKDTDKDKGGDMGLSMAFEIFNELQEETERTTVTSLKRGEYSDVLKASEDNWIFFRAEETPYMADLLLEENLAKIRNYMNRFEGGRIENWLVALTEELLAESKEQGKTLFEYVENLKQDENPLFLDRFRVLENTITANFGPVSLNYGNMGGDQNDRGLMLFPNTINTDANPELIMAASNEVFWRNAFFTPLYSPSSPFALGDSIAVLTPMEETFGDETSIENISNFYAWGWMYNSTGMEINAAFMASDKFENNFFNVFMPMIFGKLAGQ